VREVLVYDPVTGVFTRRVRTGYATKVGQVAGSADKLGYLHIRLDAITHKAHRLAWLYVYGETPDGPIDHINGNPSDNRIANLRHVTPAMNSQNRRTVDRRNTSGFLGVTKANKRGLFAAQISWTTDGVTTKRTIGHFATPDAAGAAYLAAKRELHPGNTL
jgi:hypothetical protein